MPRTDPDLLGPARPDLATDQPGGRRLFPWPGRVSAGGALEQPDPPKGGRQGGHDRPPPYRPKLVCRTHLGDAGIRPLAPGLMFWESPDIWVTAPDGTDVPVAGQPNTVHVHLWNVGAAPSYGATAELYWCDPSVGVNLANATLIGVASTTLQAGDHVILDFPWTPTFVNGGHECLVAQVFDPVGDPLVAPFNPVLDCHVGQQNVNVIEVAPGQSVKLQFLVANFSAQRARSSLQVMELRGADLQGIGQLLGRVAQAPARGAAAALSLGGVTPVRATLDLKEHPVAASFRGTLEGAPSCFRAGLTRGALDALLTRGTDQARGTAQVADEAQPAGGEASMGRGLQSGHVHLEAETQATLTLTVQTPERAAAGSVVAYRVVETVDGVVTGGMTYLIRMAAGASGGLSRGAPPIPPGAPA